MKKIFHLSTCTTCQRIIDVLNLPEGFEFQNIKDQPLTERQLDEIKEMAGSYEALFSKRARLYKEYGLKDKHLGEPEHKRYLLEHYTFLKRPLIVYNNKIFIGNSKKTVEAAKAAIHD